MKYSILLFLFLPILLLSQKPIYQKIQRENASQFKQVQLFGDILSTGTRVNEILPDLESGVLLSLDDNNIAAILSQPIQGLHLTLPFPDGSDRGITLIPASSINRNFHVKTASVGKIKQPFTGYHYWGIIDGQEQSAVSVSIFEEQIMGMILTGTTTYILGPLDKDVDNRHLLYKEEDLNASYRFNCGVEEVAAAASPSIDKSLLAPNPDNCVLMYVEADKDIFDDKGSVAAVTEYITGLFNQVSLMYFNEQVKLRLNELFVWDANDPYNSSSTSTLLSAFRNNLNGNYNGTLAHLVGYEGGGGLAQLDVICYSPGGYGYSGINPTYNNIPTYSWSINVVTHEIGHNLGSPHTHSCSWNGNGTPIDRCGIDEGYGNGGSCEDGAPLPEKGTIMSYCHLVGGVGMDFNLGFGPQPGDLIRDNVYNAFCLTPCDPAPEICDDDFDNDFDGLTDCEDSDCTENVACLPCENNIVIFTLTVDQFPAETAWTLTDMEGTVIENSNNYGGIEPGTVIMEEFCLLDDCYIFTITDTETDGICCNWGEGFYTLTTEDGQILAEGGAFRDQETVMICNGRVPEVCDDGIDNDRDGLIDCEDPDCSEATICQPCEDNTVVLQINYDLYPTENSWAILDATGAVVIEGIPFNNVAQLAIEERPYCIADGCYTFVMYDSEDDGMCCQFGQGAYQLINTFGEVLASGASFTNEERTDFCIENAACPTGNVYTVTTSANTGLGSLRQAILCCNAIENLDTIIFDLAATDTLFLEEALPPINDNSISIDGGENTVLSYTGTTPLFTVNANFVDINKLTLIAPVDSDIIGILSLENNLGLGVKNCVIRNFKRGVHLQGRSSSVENNTFFVPGFESGVYVDETAIQTTISGNTFSSEESGYGVYTRGDTIEISNNEMYNLRSGLYSFHSNRIDIKENVFHDSRWAIFVLADVTYGQEHLISKNSLYCNQLNNGIKFIVTTNGDHPIPEITEITSTLIRGTAIDGDEIEVFSSDNSSCTSRPCQGTNYIGSTFADPDGNWILDGIELEAGMMITANATDNNHNSSLFSDCMEFTIPCSSATLNLALDAAVICPEDAALFTLQSDIPMGETINITYLLNGEMVSLENLTIGEIFTIPVSENSTFQLLSAANNFDCDFEVSNDEIQVSIADSEQLSSAYNTTLCIGDTLFLPSQQVTESGVYTEIYQSNLLGCDSTVNITVEMIPLVETFENKQICEGQEIEIFGEIVNTAGIYEATFTSQFDCDSIHTIELEVVSSIQTFEDRNLCEGQSIIVFGEEINEAGEYQATFTSQAGCDSTHHIAVELLENIHTFGTVDLCEGQSIIVFDEEVSEAGVYEATFEAQSGCDSIHQITVELVETIHTFENRNLCEGQSIIVFDEEVNEAGVYEANFSTLSGCDSVHQITVELVETIHTFENRNLCEGQSIIIFGEDVNEAGEYQATFTAQSGCDSIHQITVQLVEAAHSFATATICTGQEIEIFGEIVSEAGEYTANFTAANGCDSIHTITLEVLNNIETFETLSACLGQNVVVFGETYTEDAIATAQFTSVGGCDSIHQVTITFVDQITTEASTSICPGESVEVFGELISEAGDYTETFESQLGCDSIHTIHIIQLEAVNTSEEMIICEGETAIIFEEPQTEAGLYTETFDAANGCDSVHQIELIVLENSESSMNFTICEGESADIFGEIVSEAGIYTETFQAANGCDSLVSIELIVNENPVVEAITLPSCTGEASGSIELIAISEATPFSYEWGHTDENTALLSGLEAGEYEYTVTDENNCRADGVLTIESSTSPSYEIEINEESCQGAADGSIIINSDDPSLEISINDGAYSSTTIFDGLESNNYTLAIRNAAGCESVETVAFPPPPFITLSVNNIIEPSCTGDENGSISVEAQGGVEYQWNTGQTGATINGLGVGSYSVTATSGSCEVVQDITLEGLAPIQSNLQVNIGCGDGQIIAIAQPEFGQEPYNIEWSTNQSGLAIGGLTAGFYSLSITDANDCTLEEDFEIPFVAPFQVNYNAQDVSCFEAADGAINLMISGGIPPYEVLWDNGETTENLDHLAFGTYAFNVSAASCSFASEIQINAPSDITVDVLFAPFGNDGIMGTAIPQGGTQPYTYQWSNGQTTLTVGPLTQGQEIGLTITDANGCEFVEVYTAIVTNITQLEDKVLFNVFPNPTYNELIIESISGFSLDYDLQLYNTAGSLLMQFRDQQLNRQVLSLQDLPTGVYLLIINTEQYSQVKRIVVLE